ncbi:TPA: phage tail fiber protein [Klebsiella quasipneumoniae subsp. similipneumoniae]
MSVPNQTPYIIYNANGLTTVFPFEFYIISASDIQVSLNGTPVTTGFTVSGVGNVSGGDLTFLTPPANGTVVMLERVVPTYRLTDYQDNGDLLADTVNKDFDRLWMAIQRSFIYLGLALRRPLLGGPFNAEGYRIEKLADPVDTQDAATKNYVDQVGVRNLNRTLRVPENYVAPLAPAEQRANRLQAYNAEGNPIFVRPESGSAADVLVDLASTEDGKGDALIGVKQPYVGAVGRTQHDKNADTLSVKDFGAKGDGFTDDSDSFIAAINSSAKKIVIPDGNYIISKAIPLRGNLEISGGVNSVLKLKDNVSKKPGAIFDKSDATIIENVKLSGFTIDLNRLNNWTFGAPDKNGNETQGDNTLGIGVRSINNLVLEGLTVRNSRRDGIWVVNCQNFKVVNCHVYDCCNTGLSIRNDIDAPNGLKNGLIEGNIAHGCTVGLHGIFAVSNCTYHGNVCFNNKDANRFLHNYNGVYPNIYPNIGGYNTPSDAAYKTFANPGDGAGIEFTTSPMDPVTKPANRQIAISGNSCNGNMHGIRAEGASKFLSITGNSCNDNERHGVFVLAADYMAISGNNLVGNGISGVCVERPTNVDASAVGTVPANPSGFSISGNLITASGKHGIMLFSTGFSSIVGNTLIDNNKSNSPTGGAIGVYSTDGELSLNNTITGNVLRGGATAPYAIYLNDSNFSTNNISSNSISSFASFTNDVGLVTRNLVTGNIGYITEMTGVATIGTGGKSVHVSAPVGKPLTSGSIQVTPANDVGGDIRWWVGNPSGNGFDIFISAPATSNILFYWSIS